MITIHRYQQLGRAEYGWLDTHYHFSFANYYNPNRMGLGSLRVINDDIIKPQTGFAMHPHNNMEIITFVKKGAITHQDNQGNKGRTEAGDIQVMTAGTGIYHSEYNLEDEETHLFQIWIKPKHLNLKPSWATHHFPKQASASEFELLVSGDGNAPLTINQEAKLYAPKLNKDSAISHQVEDQAYLLVAEGSALINDIDIHQGDGVEITQSELISLRSNNEAKLVLIEI